MTRSCSRFAIANLRCLLPLCFLLLIAAPHTHAATSLRGVGAYEELGQVQFFVGVYTQAPYADANELILSRQDKAMEIRVVANKIYSRRFKRMWQEGAAINSAPAEYKKYSNSMVAFSDMLQLNMAKGDILRLERRQASGMEVSINGTSLGKIVAPEFFDLLLRVLVGPVPVSVDLKSALLSGKPANKTVAEFISIKPEKLRQELILDNIEQQQQAILAMSAPKIDAPEALVTKQEARPKASTRPEAAPSPRPTPVVVAQNPTPRPKAPTPRPKAPTPRPKAPVAKPEPSPEPKDLAALIQSSSKTAQSNKVNVEAIAQLQQAYADEDDNAPPERSEEAVLASANLSSDTETELVARQSYYTEVVTKISRGITKTKESAPMGNTRLSKTIVRVNIIVRRTGGVKKIDVVTPSSKDTYNKAAVVAVQQAVPFTYFPDNILDDELEMTVPIAIDWLYVTELDRAGLI